MQTTNDTLSGAFVPTPLSALPESTPSSLRDLIGKIAAKALDTAIYEHRSLIKEKA